MSEEKTEEISNILDDSKPTKDTTRKTLASIFVYGFFGVIVLCFFFCFFYNYAFCDCKIDLKDLLLTVAGILSGPLGFVFGYYFKNEEEGK